MSEESKPEELRLPEELAALEALLAAKPLAAAGIDRDQLMYRAGWAACEAALMQPRPSAGGRFEVPETSAGTRSYPPAEPGAARGTIPFALARLYWPRRWCASFVAGKR
jgi:hypothetical protein